MGFFDKIKKIGIFNGFSELTEDFYEELEESLVMADLGAEITMEAVDELRERCKARHIKDTEGARQCMRDILAEYLDLGGAFVDMSNKPAVILFIGGMIMVMLGICGEYIGRIYISLNSSPQYVVRDTCNLDRPTPPQ